MDVNRIYDAFRRAHEAGDTESAQKLADFIKTLPSYQAPGQAQQDAIQSQIQQLQEDDRVGYFEGLRGGTKRLLSDSTTTLESLFMSPEEAALRGIKRGDAITERPGTSFEKVKELYETEGLGAAAKETLAQIPAAFGEQTPFIGSIIVGARLGLTVAGPYGAIAGSLLVPFLQASGGAMERKAQTQLSRGEQVDIDKMNAYATGLGSAALERAALGFSGLARLFGISLKSTAKREIAEKIARESIASSLARGGGRLIAAEVPTEMAQSVLERYYAGLSLTDEDAKKEYAEAAFGASLLAPLGMYQGVTARGVAKRGIEAEDYLKGLEDDASLKNILEQEISDEDKQEIVPKIKSRKKVEKNREDAQSEINDIENEIIGTDVDNNAGDNVIFDVPNLRGDKDDRTRDKPKRSGDGTEILSEPEFNHNPKEPETFVGDAVDNTESDVGGTDDTAGGIDNSLKVFTAKNGAKYTGLQLKQKAAEFLDDPITAGLANSPAFLDKVKAIKQNFGQEAADIFYSEGLLITEQKVKQFEDKKNVEEEKKDEGPATPQEIFAANRRKRIAEEQAKKNLEEERKKKELEKQKDEELDAIENEELLKEAEGQSDETFIDSVRNRVDTIREGDRQQELPGIETIQEFNVTLKSPVIQEFVNTYNSILQREGSAAAESYRINKLGTDPRLKEVLSEYYSSQEIIPSVEQEKDIYTSFNLDKLKQFQLQNNLNDYIIRKDLGFEGKKEKIVSYSLVPRKKLGIDKNSTSEEIKEKAGAYIAEDTQRVGKEYGFVFGKRPTPELVDKFLKDTLDKTEYEIIKNKTQLKDIANRFKKLTPLEKDFSVPKKEEPESNRRVKEFNENIQGLEGYDEFINVVKKLNLDIEKLPRFLKSGVVFGAKNSPITQVNNINELFDYVLSDYIFEESADTTGYTNKFEDSNLSSDDKKRRAKIRKEFYDSPILDAYLKKFNIPKKRQKDLELEFDFSLDALVEKQKAIHKSADEYYYNNRKTKEDLEDSQTLTQEQIKGIRRTQIEQERDRRLLEILRTEGAQAAREYATRINKINMRRKANAIKKERKEESSKLKAAGKPTRRAMQLTDEDLQREAVEREEGSIASWIIESSGNMQDAVKNLIRYQDKRIQMVQRDQRITEKDRVIALRILNFQKELLISISKVGGLRDVPVFMASRQVMKEQYERTGDKMGKSVAAFYQFTQGRPQDNAVFISDAFTSKTTIELFLHEATHVATVFGLESENMTDAERANWDKIYKRAVIQAEREGKKYYGLKNLDEFIAEAFSNIEFQRFLQGIKSVSDPQPSNKYTSLFDDLVIAIKRMFRNENLDNTLLGDTIKASARLFSFGVEPIPGSLRERKLQRKRNYVLAQNKLEEGIPKHKVDEMIPPSTRTEFNVKNLSKEIVDETKEANRTEEMIKSHERRTRTFPRRIGDFFNSWLFDGQNSIDKVVTTFANKSYFVKKWQDTLEYANLLISGEKGFNNVFTQLSLVFGQADGYMRKLMLPLQDYEMSLRDFEDLYLQQNPNATQAEARAYLQDILTGLHENERRQVKYMLQVPLSTEKIMRLGNGKLTSPADYRNTVMKIITTKNYTDPNQRKLDLELYKNQLLKLTDPSTRISGVSTVDPEGGVGYRANKDAKKLSDNIASPEYDVTSLSYDQAQQLRNQYELLESQNPELYASINNFIEKMQIVQEETKVINTIGRYAPPQALNVIDFYGWKNYIPMKGKANTDSVSETVAKYLDPAGTSTRMSRDLKKLESSFEGSQADAEEPFTQIIVDASMAAARAGRINYTESIYNALTTTFEYIDKQGKKQSKTPMEGSIVRTFTYEERYTNDPAIEQALQAKNTIVHFLEDGSLVVMSIKDDNLLGAIRNSYNEKNPLIDIANTITGTIGQFHTRFNPKFAPLNFTRDAITDMWYVATDLGMDDLGGFTQDLAEQVFNGGMRDTWKIISLYNRGKIDERDAYAKKRAAQGDTWAQDMVDYLEEGGMVAYQQALSNQTAFEKSQELVGATKYLRTKREITLFFDTYMGNFELATRVAAYRTKKRNILAKKSPGNRDVPADIEKGAREEAAAYAKRLSNFEEMGTAGRTMGGFYMFFRASSVGATRALETVGPAFRDFSDLEQQTPDYIKNSPENLKAYRESLAKKKEAAQTTMVTGLGFGMAMFYMAAALSEGDGDENKTLGDDLARWTRYARFDISGITGNKNDVIQIPWGFGIGGIPAIGAQIAGLISSRENPPINIIGNIVNITLDSFAPLPISRMDPTENAPMWFFDSIVPSSVRPVFEYIVNKNAFGAPIYTQQARARYGTVNQGKDNTPEIYKDLALAVANATGGEFTIDPNILYFFSNNYIDGFATTAQNLYSLSLSLRGQQEFNLKSDTILFGSFISKYSELDQRAYNRARKQIEQLDRKMNLFEKTDIDRYYDMVAKYPTAEGIIQQYNLMNAELNKLNQEATIIRNLANVSRKEKKFLLDDIKEQQLILKRQIAHMVDMELSN